MKFKILVTALLLSLALPAAAQFTTIAAAYEVAASDLRLPQSESGTIAYKRCAECSYETKRVDESTVWEINGARTTLEKFRRTVSRLENPGAETVQVLHHLDRDRVTKVWILID